jgi:hypothetical protein
MLQGCWGAGLDPQLDARLRATSRPASQSGALANDGSRWPQQPDAGVDGADAGEEPALAPTLDAPPAPSQASADDAVRCGDGTLDATELCDVAIAQGQPGACPTACHGTDPCHPQALQVHTCWSHCAPVAPAPGTCL